jgi:hypothetical protein
MIGEKGLKEDDWADRNNWRRKRAKCRNGRRKMETSYSLLNNNNVGNLILSIPLSIIIQYNSINQIAVQHNCLLTLSHTHTAGSRSEPPMSLLLVLAFCQ